MHVLPQGFHRIRYYGWLTSQTRVKNIACIRELLAEPLIPIGAIKAVNAKPEEPKAPEHPCPCCGGRMRIIETFLRGNSRSTAARRFRQRSGSTPHDADASPRHTWQHSPPVVALARQRRRLPRHAGLLRNHKEKTQNLVAQNALLLDRTSTYVPPTWQNGSRCRFASSQAHLSSGPNPHSTRGTAAAHIPRFRALALFGRRPLERVDNPTIPASENLHTNGPSFSRASNGR